MLNIVLIFIVILNLSVRQENLTELIQIKVKKTTSIQNTKYTHKVKKNKYFFLKLINCSNIERQGKNEVIAS